MDLLTQITVQYKQLHDMEALVLFFIYSLGNTNHVLKLSTEKLFKFLFLYFPRLQFDSEVGQFRRE